MDKVNVLITGAGGSAASYLIDYLREDPCTELIRFYHHDTPAEHNCFGCDMQHGEYLEHLLDITRPDIIYHFASKANVRESFDHPVEYTTNNIELTANLFEAVRRLNLKCRIVLASTSEVYGAVQRSDNPITEAQPLAPINPYAVSKTTQDMLAQVYHRSYGLDIIIVRMFGYINPRRADLASTSWARQIAEIELGRRELLLHGNLKTTRTFLDPRDMAEAYFLAAKYGKSGEIYNVGSTTPVSGQHMLDTLIECSTSKIRTKLDENLLRPTDITLQVPDVTKFEDLTGFKPRFTFKQSIQHLMEESRAHVSNLLHSS